MRQILVIAAIMLFVQIGVSQDRQPDEGVVRIETIMVEVPVSVASGSEKPILNLQKGNFLVFEDGKPQEVVEFGATTAPFEVVLLLDTSGSTRGDLALIKREAAEFIGSLRSGDRVSIIAYRTDRTDGVARSKAEVVSGLTDDRAVLLKALERVGTSNGTPFYDSLLWVTDEIFAEKPSAETRGRRALVALTDGVDSVSLNTFSDVRSAFEEAGLSVYFIKVDTREYFEEGLLGPCEGATRFSVSQIRRFYRRYYPGRDIEKVFDFCKLGDFERLAISKGLYSIADAEMRELTTLSGGGVIPVAELSEARTAFKKVAGEIGTRYSLVYYSTNEKRDGAFRRIRVELKDVPGGVVVKAREGYRAPVE